jgi:hypothetical protein
VAQAAALPLELPGAAELAQRARAARRLSDAAQRLLVGPVAAEQGGGGDKRPQLDELRDLVKEVGRARRGCGAQICKRCAPLFVQQPVRPRVVGSLAGGRLSHGPGHRVPRRPLDAAQRGRS